MTFGPRRHLATLSELRERDLYTFGNTLLKIAISHPLSNLRVRTFTINSGDVPPLGMFGQVPPPPPVNQTLSRHDVNWQPSVTIYSDDSCRVWLETMYCYYK